MMQVVGFKSYNFKDKSTGDQVQGTTIFLQEPIKSDNGSGLSTDKFSLSPQKVKDLPCSLLDLVGCQVELSYNKYQKVDKITVIEK